MQTQCLSILFVILLLNVADGWARPEFQVDVFVASRCRDCDLLEQFLHEGSIPYRRIDLEHDREGEADYLANIGRGIVPVTRIGSTILRGFRPGEINDLWKKANAGTLPSSPRNYSKERPQTSDNHPRESTAEEWRIERTESNQPKRDAASHPEAFILPNAKERDISIQLLTQGARAYAGFDNTEISLKVDNEVFTSTSDPRGIVQFKNIPCDRDAEITSSAFASTFSKEEWRLAVPANCQDKSLDLGAYSNFKGAKVLDAIDNSIQTGTEARETGARFAKDVLENYNKAKAAKTIANADSKETPEMQRERMLKDEETQLIDLLRSSAAKLPEYPIEKDSYRVSRACVRATNAVMMRESLQAGMEDISDLIARSTCACLSKRMPFEQLSEDSAADVITLFEKVMWPSSSPLEAGGNAAQKVASANWFQCMTGTQQDLEHLTARLRNDASDRP